MPYPPGAYAPGQYAPGTYPAQAPYAPPAATGGYGVASYAATPPEPEPLPAVAPAPAVTRPREAAIHRSGPVFSWDSLVLREFGPFQDPVRLGFPVLISALADSDEARRADVATCLAAVVLGPEPLEGHRPGGEAQWRGIGELEFTLPAGDRYRLLRDFSGRHVEMSRISGESEQPVVSCAQGEPSGEGRIRALVGLEAEALYVAATVGSGTDPDALVAALRPLTVSVGPTPEQEAIIERLRPLTRGLEALGLPGPDGAEDGELEAKVRLIAQDEARLEETGRLLEALDGLESESEQLRFQEDALERDLEGQRKEATARQRHASLSSRYRSSCRIRNSATDALDRARILEAELQQLQQQLSAEPANALLDDSTESDLETLARLEWDRTRLKDRIRELDTRYEEAEKTLATLKEAPSPAEDEAPVAPATAKAAQPELEDLSDLPDFSHLGAPALMACANLRDQRREALQLWQRYHDDGKRLEELERMLVEYGNLEQTDSVTLERLRTGVILREKYHKQLREVGREVELADFQKNWVEMEQTRLREAAAELGVLDPDLVPAVEAKVRILEQREKLMALDAELRQEALQTTRSSDIATICGSLFGLAGGALYSTFFGGDACLLIPGAGAFIGLAACTFTRSGGSSGAAELRNAYDQLNKKTKEVDERLKDLAFEPLHRLTAFLERAERLAEHQQTLDDMERKLPRAKRVSVLRQQKEEAEKGLAELDAQVEAIKNSNQDAWAALHAVTGLRREHELLKSDREALLRDEWGVKADNLDCIAASSCGGRWRSLALLAHVMARLDIDLPIVALVEWLDKLDDDWWRELEKQAEAYDLRVARNAARAAVAAAGLPAQPTAADASARSAARDAARHGQLEIAQKLVDELSRQRDEAEAHLIGGNRQIVAITRRLFVLLEKVRGDVQAAKEKWRRITGLRQGLAAREATLHAVLDSWQANDVATLAEMVASFQKESATYEAELAQLRALVPEGSGDDSAVAQQLEERTARIEQQRDEVRRQLSLLATEKARLEGRPMVNMLAVQEDLARHRSDHDRLVLKVRGLAALWQALDTLARDDRVALLARFEASVNERFQVASGRSDKRIIADESGHLSLVSGIRTTPSHRLESFVRDQLALSVRLAALDLAVGGRPMPVFVDTMAPASDEDRKTAFLDTLGRVAGERQVVILGHPEVVESWAPPVGVVPVPPLP